MVPGHVDNARRVDTERKSPTQANAYDLLLRADWLFHQNFRPAEGMQPVEKALEIDPEYAIAHATLANHHAYSPFILGTDHSTAANRSKVHCEAAARHVHGDAEVQVAIGEAYILTGEHALAAHHTDQVLASHPNSFHVRAHGRWSAVIWAIIGGL